MNAIWKFASVLVVAAGLLSAGAADVAPASDDEIDRPISAAKWIYAPTADGSPAYVYSEGGSAEQRRFARNRDDPDKTPTNVCIRLGFDVRGKVRKAEIWYILERCTGYTFNGEKVSHQVLPRFKPFIGHEKAYGRDFAPILRQGHNVFAFSLFRVPLRKTYGLILRGVIEYEDGRREEICSAAASARCALGPEPAANWRSPDFDDSAWKRVLERADARMRSFVYFGDIEEMFCSPAEYAAYREKLSRGFPEKKLLAEPDSPNAKVVYHGLIPAIETNGKILSPNQAAGGGYRWTRDRDAMIRKYKAAGYDIYRIDIREDFRCDATDGSEKGHFEALDREIRRIFALNPEARILFCYNPYISACYGHWLETHSDEQVRFAVASESRAYADYTANPLAPSIASKPFRAEMVKYWKKLGAFCRAQPWGRRVLAAELGWGPSGDGMNFGAHAMPDTGVAMTKAFRAYLMEKYGTVKALQSSWNDSSVTFENAAVPDAAAREGSGAYLRDAADPRDRRLSDYYTCYHREYGDLMLAFARGVKEAFPGALVGAFAGYSILGYDPPGANSGCLDRLLASPDFDFLYGTTRGYHLTDGLQRHIHSRFRHYGKLSSSEGDIRPYMAFESGEGEFCWSTRTPAESRAAMMKLVCNTFFNGNGFHTVTFGNPAWFDAPEMLDPLVGGQKVWKRLFDAPPELSADVAVIFDNEPTWKEGHPRFYPTSHMFDNLVTYPLQTLNFSGYAYDLYAPADFATCKRDYKAVVFLNTFEANGTLRAAAKRARQAGSTVMWCYAPGLQAPKGFSRETMREVTGLDLDFTRKPVKLEGCLTDGQDYSFRTFARSWTPLRGPRWRPDRIDSLAPDSPRVWCRETDVEKLATWNDDQTVSQARKVLADGSTAVFLGASCHSCVQWMELLRKAGCHAFTRPGFYVRRNSRLLMVASCRGASIPQECSVMAGQIDQFGSVEVKLEKNAKTVTDAFTGEVVACDTDRFTLESPEMRVWLLEIE